MEWFVAATLGATLVSAICVAGQPRPIATTGETLQPQAQKENTNLLKGAWISDKSIELLSDARGGAVTCDYVGGHELLQPKSSPNIRTHEAVKLTLDIDQKGKLTGALKLISHANRCNQVGYSLVEEKISIEGASVEESAISFSTSSGVRWRGKLIDSNILEFSRHFSATAGREEQNTLRFHRSEGKPAIPLKLRISLANGSSVSARTVPLELSFSSDKPERVFDMTGVFAIGTFDPGAFGRGLPTGTVRAYISDFELALPPGAYRITFPADAPRWAVTSMRAEGVDILKDGLRLDDGRQRKEVTIDLVLSEKPKPGKP
jgi:hypothetical protein